MAKKVTMQQIANYLGVSKFVVSKALSGKGGVSESTKEKVIAAATKLGYLTERVKVKQKVSDENSTVMKQTVIVLMPNIRFQTKESRYWGRIVEGITRALEARGLGLVIIAEQSVESIISFINPNGVFGMIGVGEISTAILLEVERLGITTVLIDHEDELVHLDTIFADNFDSIYRLTKQFIHVGKTNITFIGNNEFSRSFLDRYLGYSFAITHSQQKNDNDYWLDNSIVDLQGVVEIEYEQQIDEWLDRHAKLPDVMMCANDDIAFCVMRLLDRRGITVPHQVCVTGFDNLDLSYKTSIPITTIDVPKEMLGKKAVDRLIERIQYRDEPVMKVLVKSEIMFRNSTII